MDLLPDELLLLILEELPPHELLGAVSQVCRRWAALAKRLALLVDRPDQLQELNRQLRLQSVRVLTRLTSNVLNGLLSQTQFLRDLTICSATSLTNDHFQGLTCMQHLEHLDVFLQSHVVDVTTVPILSRLRSLVVNETVRPRVISALANSRLESLHMYGHSLYFPRRDLIKLLSVRGSYLRELTLRCTELHDSAYAVIGQCQSLIVLQLYSCWLMTAAGALQVTRPPRLKCLHVTGARMVRTSALSTFLAHLPVSLEELVLSVSSFRDEHATALINLPKLHTLELWRCRLSGEGVLTLAQTVPSLCILDLDVKLTDQQIRELDRHPSLYRLRCLTETSIKPSENLKSKQNNKVDINRIKILNTNERYPNKYFRSSGEGYRGSLFYYWTQKMDLKPLPSKCIPGFDDYDDFY